MSEDEKTLLRGIAHYWRLLNDRWYRIQHYKIRDDDFNIIDFKFNNPQRRFMSLVQSQMDAGLPVRIIVLKARQWGGSTFTQMLMFDECVTSPNTECLVLSYEKDSAEWLSDMSRRAYDEYPEELLELLPEKVKDSSLKGFKLSNDSNLSIATAENLRVGRSTTRKMLHISEVGLFRHTNIALGGLLSTVPKQNPNTIVVLESTAQGTGDYFHKTWLRASDYRVKSRYLPLFIGWHEIEKNTMPFVDGGQREAFRESMSKYEAELQDFYKLTLEQLHWRRDTLENECGGDENMLRQEHPINAHEAFVTTGNPRFNVFILDEWMNKRLEEQKFYGPEKYSINLETGEFEKDTYGELLIFEEPQHGDEYVIGVDPAEGKSVSEDGKENDNSVIQVFRRRKEIQDGSKKRFEISRQVAEWVSNKHEMSDTARAANYLGLKYNKALINVESNIGQNVLYVLINELNYPFLVHKLDTTKGGTIPLNEYGFYTSAKQKKFITDLVAQIIKDREIELFGIETIKECQTFVRNKTSKLPEAQSGCKDDRVMALCMAVYADYVHDSFKTKEDSVMEDQTFDEIMKYMNKNYGGKKPRKRVALVEPKTTWVHMSEPVSSMTH